MQHVEPALWTWKAIISAEWNLKGEHINALEVRADGLQLKWRLRTVRNLNTRFVHLVDSLVSKGVAAKGRTSAGSLKSAHGMNAAMLLAGFLYPVNGFCRSHTNPSDAPSRRKINHPHSPSHADQQSRERDAEGVGPQR